MKPLLKQFLTAATLLIIGASAPLLHGAELSGLKVGEKAPAFSLPNQDGVTVQLSEALKKGPVALVFYRSADW